MESVGIITVHKLPNWGSVMQGFALQKIICQLGYDCECIDYLYPNEWHISRGCWKPLNISIKSKIARLLGMKPPLLSSLVDSFIAKEMNVSQSFDSYEAIHKNPPKYDIYVSGSDQIWNWKTMYGDTTYLLDFAPDNCKKIAYSSSFSVDEIPIKYCNIYKKYLSRYNSISVRENGGNKIIKKLLGKPAKVVLDPTLLLQKSEWDKLAEKAKWKKRMPSKYILCYTLGYTYNPNKAMAALLHSMQEKYNCPVVFVGRVVSEFDGKIFNYRRNQGIGVYEFIWLVKHATVFVTSSFHGTAFSVNLGTPFLSLVEKKEQADDRIPSFLIKVGLEDHLVTVSTDFDNLQVDGTYDVSEVQERLEIMRADSLNWLKEALVE